MDFARRMKLFGIAIMQFVKFVAILAIIGGIGYGAYFAWTKFIKDTVSHVEKGNAANVEKKLNPK